MYKHLFRTALGLVGIMGTLAIGVANASDTSCWEGKGTVPTTTYASGIVYGCDGSIPIITIYGKNGNNEDVGITIKAMNEGATAISFSGNDTNSFGNTYQRGNNYPFPSTADTTTLIISGATAISAEGYAPGTYSNETWIKQGKRDSSDNRNLWGGSGDEKNLNGFWGYDTENFVVINTGDRKAMCPDGYHIPTIGEWNALLYLWGRNSGISSSYLLNSLSAISADKAGIKFSEDMQIPFVACRGYESNVYSYDALTCAYGNYWSSSPYNHAEYAYRFYLYPDNLYANGDFYRGYGYAVRCFKNEYVNPTISKDIKLEATSTAANQKIKINKYFANAYTVDWGDGTTGNLTADTTHTYSTAGTYIIILSLSGADRWTFQSVGKPLVPTNGTTMTGVKITSMPSLEEGFGANATAPGNSFFSYFNYYGQLTSLPTGSFDTSKITTAGNNFFSYFNINGKLTSLPTGSFNTSNISGSVGDAFFMNFNYKGALTSLPTGSFDISNISGSVGDSFFSYFNSYGQLTSLPTGSFDTSKITAAGNGFFSNFSNNGQLTSLPTGSFDISNISGSVGDSFFSSFNAGGQLTSLPTGSFDTSEITTAGDNFFSSFNYRGQLTSLPTGSFDTSNITTAGNRFFTYFNYGGQLTSLPTGSFDTSKITAAGNGFFSSFNDNGQLTSLPTGSFDTSNITTVGSDFFSSFNNRGQLTSLPTGSFDTSKITTAGNYFFSNFNNNGQLTSLPTGSFDTSKITTAGTYFFSRFNYRGQLTSLPTGSFDTSNITTVGSDFFSYFNSYGQLTSLPTGSFDTSKITAAGTSFFQNFNYNGKITTLPDSFKLTSAAYDKTDGYKNAFNSSSYTFNMKVSDLVSGITVPSSDRNTFSDNQPGRCGVHENWLVNPETACNIVYDANGGTGTITGGYMSNATGVVPGSGITLPTREGYTFSGWLDASGNKVDEIVFPDMDGETLYANWEANVYTITLDIDGTLTTITGSYGSPITPPANPIKNGYKFVGWEPEIPATMPAKDMTIKAKWEKNGSSGGGGGSNKSSSDVISNDSEKSTEQKDGDTGMDSSAEPQNDNQNAQDSQQADQASDKVYTASSASEGHTYTQEFQEAYEFAKGKGITTMPTIQKADMDGKLTRIAMAKMLSQYAINVLGMAPDITQNNKFNDVTEKMDSDYDDGVTLAYQLGIMGQNMSNNKFRPNDEVTRGEFVTALSRMLYNTSDGEYRSTPKYYTHHMEKMVGEGIITNTDPNMKELRGYVMIMLMRSVK